MNITTNVNIVPRKVQRGWKIYEGDEVKNSKNSRILNKLNDIKRNTIVTIKNCFGKTRKAKCEAKKGKSSWAYDTEWDYASYTLEFNKDDRHCWVCTCTNHMDKSVLKDLRG